MSAREELKWRDAIKDRVEFYRSIILAIGMDALFLLAWRAIVIVYRWGANKLQTGEESVLSTQHILGNVLDWGAFIIVVLYALYDAIQIGRKLSRRLKAT